IPGIEWASNLAGPDMLWRWKGMLPNFLAGEASGWLGPYFNLLPLISAGLLFLHPKLFSPPAPPEKTKMTPDIMKYMTPLPASMFCEVPAGLCIYFITSSLWPICERLWLPKSKPAAVGETVVEAKSPPAKTSSNGADDNRSKRQKQKRR